MKFNWKSAEFILACILAVQLLVMFIDLDTKNRIVKESVKLREALENGGIRPANDTGSGLDNHNDVSFPGSMVDNGTPGVGTGSNVSESTGNGKTPAPRKRTQRANNPPVSPGNSGVGA